MTDCRIKACPKCSPAPPCPNKRAPMTTDRALALFGHHGFFVRVVALEAGDFAVLVTGEDGEFFKHKNGPSVLDALAYIATYHSELERAFEALNDALDEAAR